MELMVDLSALARRRVLVTGASGFIGSCLCSRLLTLGSDVHGVSRSPRQESSHRAGGHWWQADLANIGSVQKVLGEVRPDVVFHLAGTTRADRRLDLILESFQANVLGTVNLLTAAAGVECSRIVLAGSLEEPVPGAIPTSPYAAGKLACSAYARMFHEVFDLPVVIARLFMIYGPGRQSHEKLIPYVTLSLLRGEAPRLTSGQRLVDWVYVEDVVEGLLAMACARGIDGQTLDLGSGTLVSIREVVSRLVRIVGTNLKPEFNALPDRSREEVRAARVDDSRKHLGWKARTSLNEGLRRTVAWFRSLRFEYPVGIMLKVVVASGALSFLQTDDGELAASLLGVLVFCGK